MSNSRINDEANRRLRDMYPFEHREFYLEELGRDVSRGVNESHHEHCNRLSKAYSRAFTKLRQAHQEDFNSLRKELIKELYP